MTTDDQTVYDVLIIGAGPCGLAVAARLREECPSALYTDEEHTRFHFLKQHRASRMSLVTHPRSSSGSKRVQAAKQNKRDSTARVCNIKVIDSTGNQWLAKWNSLFDVYRINTLRSPLFFHVAPADRDALLAFAHSNKRAAELTEIAGCVGKEVSKHRRKMQNKGIQSREALINERDRQDYYTPSTTLFKDHCQTVAESYGLDHVPIDVAAVWDIDYGDHDTTTSGERLFKITTNSGVYLSRTTVLAIGAGGSPIIPDDGCCCRSDLEAPATKHCCHSLQIKHFPAREVSLKIAKKQSTSILICGGGLTSAQLADLAINRGVSHVYLIMRGPRKVKAFDVDLEYMSKFSNVKQSQFWMLDTDEERLETIKSARGGGSITPRYSKILDKHIQLGRLTLLTYTRIIRRAYDETIGGWQIEVTDTRDNVTRALPTMDYLYFATGVQPDFTQLPFLQTMLRTHPIEGAGGLPCLTQDLAWSENVPLYIAGRLASLQLGPTAANLAGARAAAERIALSLQKLHLGDGGPDTARSEAEPSRFDHARGISNPFDVLDHDASS